MPLMIICDRSYRPASRSWHRGQSAGSNSFRAIIQTTSIAYLDSEDFSLNNHYSSLII